MIVVAVYCLVVLLVDFGYLPQERSQQQTTNNNKNSASSADHHLFPVIPSSKLYTIPYSMAHIGNKSDAYANLRKDWDASYPPDTPLRSLAALKRSRNAKFDSLEPPSKLPYDIYHCPKSPDPHYPYQYPTVEVLKHWPPSQSMPTDETSAHLALCVFDYARDYVKALAYRQSEVPFVVRNDPRVAEAVERWSNDTYRQALMGGVVLHRAERSDRLSFLYWRPDVRAKQARKDPTALEKIPIDWKEPTKLVRMTYLQWSQEAARQEAELLRRSGNSGSGSGSATTQQFNSTAGPYHYFRLIGCGETGPTGDCDKIDTSEYLFDELPFFQPRPQQLYLTDPRQQKGIHCRFGMPGIVAENHFDASRNAIVVLGGQRRYILSHPRSCPHMALYPLGHPSARHSQINWTQAAFSDGEWYDLYPDFAKSLSNEVVLQSGDVLYLPTNWFHFIVSLSVNYQCNTRSGRTTHYDRTMHDCGFGVGPART